MCVQTLASLPFPDSSNLSLITEDGIVIVEVFLLTVKFIRSEGRGNRISVGGAVIKRPPTTTAGIAK